MGIVYFERSLLITVLWQKWWALVAIMTFLSFTNIRGNKQIQGLPLILRRMTALS